MCDHMLKMGGIEYYESLADKKASTLYDFLDSSKTSSATYRCINNVAPMFRSRMNVPFNIGSKETEAKLVADL